MKTNGQVLRLLSQAGFSAGDWAKVVAFCRETEIKGVKKAANPIFQMSFDEFVKWYLYGVGSGDVVTADGITAIVSDYLKDCIITSACIGKDNKLHRKKTILKNYQKADDSTRKRFYDCLAENLFAYNDRIGEVVKRFIPRAKERAYYSNKNESGIAYVWEVNKNTANAAYTVVGDTVTENVIFQLSETMFTQIDKDGIKRMKDALRKAGLALDKNSGKLIKLRPRAADGETYWYITDKFAIQTDTEKNRPVNKVRYDRGNYFTDYSEAVDFLMHIMNLRGMQ